jgi:hypothetical protein
MELVMRRGSRHETAHLELLRQREPGLVEIRGGAAAFDATQRAMQDGAPIIFPGELRADLWMGIADLLHRIEGPSDLGDCFY